MENRTSFPKGDILYLANLCHNCGECLYACQYAPPHEFGINVPRVLAAGRLESYEEYCWPPFMSGMFRRSGMVATSAVSLVSMFVVWLFTRSPVGCNEFYAVVPHGVMVGMFGVAGLLVVLAFTMGVQRALRSFGVREGRRGAWRGLRDALSLRHLHA